MREHEIPNARRVGRLNGRPVYEFFVLIRHNDSRALATVCERLVRIKAHTAAAAANAVRDEVGEVPETEIVAYGPKGGRTERFIGWESAIWNSILQVRQGGNQLALRFA